MTREEAIKIMSQMIKDEEGFLSDNTVEAHKMAIKALEQEPCEDCVSREALMHILDEVGGDFDSPREAVVPIDYIADMVSELPSVTPQHCEDCISREDLLKKCVYAPIAPVIKGDSVHYEDIVFARDIINAEPIKQEPKTGWIPVSERLPEDLEPVNITWVNHNPEGYYADIKDKPFTATGHYCKGRWYWYSSTCQDYLEEYGRCDVDEIDTDIEVTAWMPLPLPYKQEVEE